MTCAGKWSFSQSFRSLKDLARNSVSLAVTMLNKNMHSFFCVHIWWTLNLGLKKATDPLLAWCRFLYKYIFRCHPLKGCISRNRILIEWLTDSVTPSSLPGTHVHVRIFWHSYSDTSWEFTREIEEENLNCITPFTHSLRHFWAKTVKFKLK